MATAQHIAVTDLRTSVATVIDAHQAVVKVLGQLDRGFECCMFYNYDGAYELFKKDEHVVSTLECPKRLAEYQLSDQPEHFLRLDGARDQFCHRLCVLVDYYKRSESRKAQQNLMAVSTHMSKVELPDEFDALLSMEHV